MPRYLSLISYTDEGIRDVKKSMDRARDFRSQVEQAGGKVISQYWAVGDCDGAVIFEVPDDHTGATLLVKLTNRGFVRTKTLQIHDEAEFEQILNQV